MDKGVAVILPPTLDDQKNVLLMLRGSHVILTKRILLRCQTIVSLERWPNFVENKSLSSRLLLNHENSCGLISAAPIEDPGRGGRGRGVTDSPGAHKFF